ncbi:MAG: hypothetical protein AB7F89_20130 [Pirellulaceae bacterium]
MKIYCKIVLASAVVLGGVMGLPSGKAAAAEIAQVSVSSPGDIAYIYRPYYRRGYGRSPYYRPYYRPHYRPYYQPYYRPYYRPQYRRPGVYFWWG